MPSDIEPRVALEEPESTGAFVVVFREECDIGAPSARIAAMLGRAPARSVEHRRRLVDLVAAMRDDGAAVFDELRLAIVDPVACGLSPEAIEAMSGDPDVLHVRPERRMEASGFFYRFFGLTRRQDGRWGYDAPEMEPEPDPDPAPDPDPSPRPSPDPTPDPEPTPPAVETTWGLSAVRADRSVFDGSGVKVAILDTGLDLGHPDFADRRIVAESFVRGETARDGQGHGTHVAGTAVGPRRPIASDAAPGYGVAPGADLYVAKVLSDRGSGREGDILAGILWALENECEIVSMSLGRRPLPGDADGDYDRVGRFALEQGSLIIAAAGNESARRFGAISPVGAPANARSILAVAAIDEARAVANFSNGGLELDGGAVDIAAPGVDVFSAAPGARYATLSGTSMAAPHVAGVAALLAQSNATLRGRALWDALVAGAEGLAAPPRDVGAGLAQAPAADIGVA